MRRPLNFGTASTGVYHVAKVTSQSNCILQTVDQQNDLGVDAYIEFVVGEAATGCCIAIQIKSGSSYCPASGWRIPADTKHVAYWRSHSLPICGIVYDPRIDVARWADISAFLAEHPDVEQCDIPVPAHNRFDVEAFSAFRQHFIAYQDQFSDDAHFGGALRLLCHLDDIEQCQSALRALFSFHRNRLETWYFVITSLPSFRGHPLLRRLVAALSHVPGHGDIFWHYKNIISERTRANARNLLKRFLSRDGVISLLGAVEPEEGLGRGSIGQCVSAIVSVIPHEADVLSSIIFDSALSEDLRFWAVMLLIDSQQRRDFDGLMNTLGLAKTRFTDENYDRVVALIDTLTAWRWIDFT